MLHKPRVKEKKSCRMQDAGVTPRSVSREERRSPCLDERWWRGRLVIDRLPGAKAAWTIAGYECTEGGGHVRSTVMYIGYMAFWVSGVNPDTQFSPRMHAAIP
jgi:hypothetical protein